MSRENRNKPRYGDGRRNMNRSQRESFLIFCEGATEVGYFSSFRKRAKPMNGGNALSMLQDVVAYKNAHKKVDQYWAVFDKDDTSDDVFVEAIQLAEANGIRLAWSNQAFECWFIMHYRDLRHPCHRIDYEAMLRQYIAWYNAGEKGEDQGRELYRHTVPNIQDAIENAKNGFDSFEKELPPSHKQSSTKVYELVAAIIANS